MGTRNFVSNRLLVMRRKQNQEGPARTKSNFTSGFRSFFNCLLFTWLIFWDWFVVQESDVKSKDICQSELSQSSPARPEVCYLGGGHHPVLLLLGRGGEGLVEGVGQQGQHWEAGEGLADYLNTRQALMAGLLVWRILTVRLERTSVSLF